MYTERGNQTSTIGGEMIGLIDCLSPTIAMEMSARAKERASASQFIKWLYDSRLQQPQQQIRAACEY